jgi:anion-transporting  ArsA/GET3 family ATPase
MTARVQSDQDEQSKLLSGEAAIRTLLRDRRVLITVGAGGVGKTTTAAALAVTGARMGRRVLCLTIDPARRLAESLGLGTMSTEAQHVDPAKFAALGIDMPLGPTGEPGSVTAMMLDTKRTFDDLVLKYSSSRERAERLLGNRLYKYVSGSLAGTQEYMAMEKLVAVKADPAYDLIVLDTPPTANALDFLDAPARLMGALDSAAMRWFVEAFQSNGKFSFNLLARGAQAVLKGLGKITGGGFLEALSEFIAELNDLFGGFRERALIVEKALRSEDVSFLLVTSPAPSSVDEVLFFADRLRESNMPRGAFVVNRVRVAPPRIADAMHLGAARAIALDGADAESLATRLRTAAADQQRMAGLDAAEIARLESRGGAPIVRVPEFSTDVHDVGQLALLGDMLVGRKPA